MKTRDSKTREYQNKSPRAKTQGYCDNYWNGLFISLFV